MAAGERQGDWGQTALLQVQMEKSSTARAETDRRLYFFLERERRRAGIDLSSLPISLKFQINKIHFSAPLPSPPQQTKEKQFPAVCSKLLSPSLCALKPLSHFRAFEPQPVVPTGGWESPGSRGRAGAETPKKPPLDQIPAASPDAGRIPGGSAAPHQPRAGRASYRPSAARVPKHSTADSRQVSNRFYFFATLKLFQMFRGGVVFAFLV